MAGIIYEFIDGLKKETILYSKLAELAAVKKGEIIKGDIEKINNINSVEEALVLKIKTLEKQRKQFMQDIASILNINPAEITITRIEEALNNQPEEAEMLKNVKGELTKSLDTLKMVSDENMSLIKQSLEYAQFSINVLQSSIDGTPAASNYGKDDERGKSFFDAKQ